MKALIQRVKHASVVVDDAVVGQIDAGLLALIGIAPEDDAQVAAKLLQRLLTYRVFPDADGKMNRSVSDIEGGLLLVPNFTLMADTRKGMRPSFSRGAAPEQARTLFEGLCEQARQQTVVKVASGIFAADMQVSLCNDGPVTLMLEA